MKDSEMKSNLVEQSNLEQKQCNLSNDCYHHTHTNFTHIMQTISSEFMHATHQLNKIMDSDKVLQ